jgi:hypothetical protein
MLKIAYAASAQVDSLAMMLSSSDANSTPHGTYAARCDIIGAYMDSLIAVLTDGTET